MAEATSTPEVKEHPVLIATSLGPVGGIVCEPEAVPRAAILLLHTGGRSGRSGFSSEWTVLSRRLAALGAVVLRYDFCLEGDSGMVAADPQLVDGSIQAKISTDLALLDDVAAWFRSRTEELPLIVVGVCYGGRLGLELAPKLPDLEALLLVVPFLRPVDEDNRARWRERMLAVRRGQSPADVDSLEDRAAERIDPSIRAALDATLPMAGTWILIGERDADEAAELVPSFSDRGLELSVEPGVALYPGNDPDIQELVGDRIAARVERVMSLTV